VKDAFWRRETKFWRRETKFWGEGDNIFWMRDFFGKNIFWREDRNFFGGAASLLGE